MLVLGFLPSPQEHPSKNTNLHGLAFRSPYVRSIRVHERAHAGEATGIVDAHAELDGTLVQHGDEPAAGVLIRMPVSMMAPASPGAACGSAKTPSDGRRGAHPAETLLNIVGRRNPETAWTERTWQAVELKIHTGGRAFNAISSAY